MQPGTRLKETYEIVCELASGGMGAIYEARHARLGGKKFAIKVIRRDLAGQNEVLERFKREADVMTGLHHPNVVEVVDYDVSHEGEPYLVMELLQGESLDQLLERESVLPVDLAVGIVRQALLALGHAHERGVIHRDIKPANLFLVPSGDRVPVVKLLDFGIAKALTASHQLTMTRELLGTPAYMAPEQVMGAGSATGIGPHTDVYAIGAVLYHLLAGKPPLEANDMAAMVYAVAYREPVPLGQPGSIVPSLANRVSIPQPIADVVTRALRKQPNERWATAHDMRVALDHALDQVRSGAFVLATPSAFAARTPPAHGTQQAAAMYASGSSSGFVASPSPTPGAPPIAPMFATPHGAPQGPIPATRELTGLPHTDPHPTPLGGGLSYQTPTPRAIAPTQLTPAQPPSAAVLGPFVGTSPVPGTIGMAVTPAPGVFAGQGTPPPGQFGAVTPPPGAAGYAGSAAPPEKRSVLGLVTFAVVLLLLGVTMVAAAWYVTDGFREANNPFASAATTTGAPPPTDLAAAIDGGLAGPGTLHTDNLSGDAGTSPWETPDAGSFALALDSGILVADNLDAGSAIPIEVGHDAGVPWVVPQPQIPPADPEPPPQQRQEDPVAAARRAGRNAIRARSAGVRACSIAAGFMGRIGGRFRYRADGVLDSVNWHGSYPSSFRGCAAGQLRGIRIRPLPRGLSHLDVDVSWNTASPG
ncbi:MAG: protein kinase [Deltaproteobacteria bacterium]|nr:protein kinase [Deltaproteobacteria bacterium]